MARVPRIWASFLLWETGNPRIVTDGLQQGGGLAPFLPKSRTRFLLVTRGPDSWQFEGR